MCGRYALDLGGGELAKLLGCPDATAGACEARWNIAPTTRAPVLSSVAGQSPRLEVARWGIAPPWRTDRAPGRPLINARAETLFEKPAFRSAAATSRCVVPARFFYEWRRRGRRRDPFAIGRGDRALMCFAGVFERDGVAPGFAIITTEANATISGIHDRMPVILDQEGVGEWLEHRDHDPDGGSSLRRLLGPAPVDLLTARPIGDRVNDVRNEGPDLLAPRTEEQDLFGTIGCPDDPESG